jgi:hypothetical protein
VVAVALWLTLTLDDLGGVFGCAVCGGGCAGDDFCPPPPPLLETGVPWLDAAGEYATPSADFFPGTVGCVGVEFVVTTATATSALPDGENACGTYACACYLVTTPESSTNICSACCLKYLSINCCCCC